MPRVRSARAGLQEHVRFVTTDDDQRLALVEASLAGRSGRGPAFLLLHGFAQHRLGFLRGPMPRVLLERGARVFLGELRGHGESHVEAGRSWSLATHLEQDLPTLLEGVRQAASAESVHLIGHSMGGLLGCALLARTPPLASFTAVATPLVLGAGRPLVSLASALVGPFATLAPRGQRIPIDRMLALFAAPLSRPDARGAVRLLQRVTRLANPHAAEPDALRDILASADPESPQVCAELARHAVLRTGRLAGVDLVAALHGSPLPIAAVIGSDDIFAPRAPVAPFEAPNQAGPRTLIEIPGGTHMDAIAGHHVGETIERLWDFLLQAPESARAARPRRRRPRKSSRS
jgi:pimeloyl-ACP methyl ester carboxylesterase